MPAKSKRLESSSDTGGPNRLQGGQTGLGERIARWTAGENRIDTSIRGLSLHRWAAPSEQTSYMLAPSICLIGQGRKRLILGDETFEYDAHHFLITSVDLPVVAQIIEASSERPYLGLTMDLDLQEITQIILGNDNPVARSPRSSLGVAISKVSLPMLDAFNRLIDLLEHPEDIHALAPLVQREILYRLLSGEQGPRLRQITSIEGQGYRIARAIDWIKENFNKPLRIEELASKAGLSASAFHKHFRSTTAMSPLQFQKRIRLNEARRLMFMEHKDASTASYEVGYESPSQFGREYGRLFGASPKRDIRNLLEASAG